MLDAVRDPVTEAARRLKRADGSAHQMKAWGQGTAQGREQILQHHILFQENQVRPEGEGHLGPAVGARGILLMAACSLDAGGMIGVSAARSHLSLTICWSRSRTALRVARQPLFRSAISLPTKKKT